MLTWQKFSSRGGGEIFRRVNKGEVFDVFLDGLNSTLKDVWDYALKDVWHSKLAEKKTGESFLFAWEYKNKIISNNFTS